MDEKTQRIHHQKFVGERAGLEAKDEFSSSLPNMHLFLRSVTRRQRQRISEFRSIPEEGRVVEYAGRNFLVRQNVFWAFYDNPLLDRMSEIVKSGESVLDVGTGAGVIAIFAAYAGASRVVALDKYVEPVACARENVAMHGFDPIIEVRCSDMFSALRTDERFDVVMGNLPFRKKKAADSVEASMWDTGLCTIRAFFAGLKERLIPSNGSRGYLCQANFGAIEKMKELAEHNRFSVNLFATNAFPAGHELHPCEFYVYEFKAMDWSANR